MIPDNLLRAMQSLRPHPPMEEVGETPDTELEMDPRDGHMEKLKHHKKMFRKAGSPAARALHAKLKAHYEMKLK